MTLNSLPTPAGSFCIPHSPIYHPLWVISACQAPDKLTGLERIRFWYSKRRNIMRPIRIKIISLLSLLILAFTLGCRASVQDQDTASGSASTVEVSAREFSFTLSTSQVAPGLVTFSVHNDGHMPHDFAFHGNGVEQKTPTIQPGETATLELNLEGGSYTYLCTVMGHSALGMKGTFTVTP
jgi:plastocyanin